MVPRVSHTAFNAPNSLALGGNQVRILDAEKLSKSSEVNKLLSTYVNQVGLTPSPPQFSPDKPLP